jgi:iron-sulfur cluster repair protein YtfE (RIC family)
MTQACSCGCGHSATKPEGAFRPDQRVEDVSHRSPRALEVLKEHGINHCCGAQLTLAEAAAAAGVPLERLLAALAEATDPATAERQA